MNLPSKDKNGNQYLSYSCINSFYKDKDQFIKSYILKEPFIGNEYTDFGSKVGTALEKNNFDLFDKQEKSILNEVTRLDIFERQVKINYDDFYLVGYIDTCSEDLTRIIDYKTGGKGKEHQYNSLDYTQLHYYALGIRQETGIRVNDASIEFIRRCGNINTGLKVANEKPIKIRVDINEDRLKYVYYNTINIAKEISEFCRIYKEANGINN